MKEYFVGTDDFQEAYKVDAMISANALIRNNEGVLRTRKAPINVNRWMMDSGAFSQVTKYGDFIMSPEEYVRIAVRFQDCGDLACIVSQDYMCEPEVIQFLQDTGNDASIKIHQRKTVERYIQVMDESKKQGLKVPVMPVLQGWEVEDYVDHFHLYRRMLKNESINRPWIDRYGNEIRNQQGLWNHSFSKHTPIPGWIGIGSTCKRNRNPEIVEQILDALEPYTNNLKIHLFGFKRTGLRNSRIKDRIYSADSFAYDYGDRFTGKSRTRKERIRSAVRFGETVKRNNVQIALAFA